MSKFKKDKLRWYINNVELRVFHDNIKVRLSTELELKYDNRLHNIDAKIHTGYPVYSMEYITDQLI